MHKLTSFACPKCAKVVNIRCFCSNCGDPPMRRVGLLQRIRDWFPREPQHWQAFWAGFFDGWVKSFVLLAITWLLWFALILFIGRIL